MTDIAYSPQIGDVVLVKGSSLIGRIIQKSFRAISPLKWSDGLPSNHNGIMGIHAGKWCVYQAQPGGFAATPWSAEIQAAYLGSQEMKIARVPGGMLNDKRVLMNAWLENHLGTPYDYRSYISHVWRAVLRLSPVFPVQSDRRFYCTEAVKLAYRFVGLDWTNNELPTPYTVEKRVASGALEIIAEFP